MSKDPIFDEPMRQLIITLSAWKRLAAKAEKLAASQDTKFVGLYILLKMKECAEEAEKDMKDSENDLMRKVREAAKK